VGFHYAFESNTYQAGHAAYGVVEWTGIKYPYAYDIIKENFSVAPSGSSLAPLLVPAGILGFLGLLWAATRKKRGR
jgi:hypothetical protein